MLDHIIADDIAQSISIPISATQDRLLPPRAGIARCLRAHPTGFALLISEQTFQKQACIRRNTILIEQRTYPFLDLTKRRRPQRKRLFNRRWPRPRSSNHGCPWIQKSAEKATVVLGYFAIALFEAGRFVEASETIDEALDRCEQSEEFWGYAC